MMDPDVFSLFPGNWLTDRVSNIFTRTVSFLITAPKVLLFKTMIIMAKKFTPGGTKIWAANQLSANYKHTT